MAVKTFNIPILYSMDIRRFNTPMHDCLRDIGVYFGGYYWFMSGYTPVSSRNTIASAKINCVPTDTCPGGERHDIDVGKTARFNYGFDVRVNSLVPGYPDAYANITVTEVYIDPCENVTCNDYCDGTTHHFNGVCVEGECSYTAEENSLECGYVAPSINLDKIEFYKEDYISDHKLHLTGSITGLDPNKQYCVWWTCEMSPMGYYVHYNDSMDYFYINQVSSASFGNNAHIHSDSIIQSPGNYSILGVYIIEVDGTCENYVSGVLASTSLIVYHDYGVQTGLLVCNSSPDNAEIWINGTNTGEVTPKSFTDMEVGSYDVVFKKVGYYDCSKTIVVIAGEGISAFCTLIEMVITGKLSCVTIPDGAEIYLNGIYYNITNKVIDDLEPGSYNVKFTKDGYEDYITTKIVEAGLTTYVSKTLVSIFEPTGNISLDKTSYEQEELIIATWGNVNFTGGMFSIINPSGSVKKQLPVNSPAGIVYYELPSNAQLGNWSVVLDYGDIEVDSKSLTVVESQLPPEPCTQYFRVEDQYGNPVSCVIYSSYWDFSLDIPSTGEISVSLQPNETYEIVAHSIEHSVEDRKTITTCTTSPTVFVLDIPEGKINNITHEAYGDIAGENEIKFEISVTNTSSESNRFYVDLRDENGVFKEREPTCSKNIPAGETVTFHMDSKDAAFPAWSFEDVRGQAVTFELVLSNIICANVKVVDTVTHEIEEDIPVPPEIGEIGNITHEIIKQPLGDEITFYIPVKNLTNEEQCFYVNLMDPNNEADVLEKAPNIPFLGRIANRIAAGDTEIIELSSTWDIRWNINNVLGQIVKFELRCSEPVLDVGGLVICNLLKSMYNIVDEITYDLTDIAIIVNTRIDNIEGLITKNMEVGLLYVDPTTITKTDICNSPINITGILNTEIVTSWLYPGPFTCSGKAYPADSMFVAYVRGYDDDDNEYYEISNIFRSIYGTNEVSLKVTSNSLVDENGCYIDHPFDPTKCLVTDKQAKFLMWGGIIVTFLYTLSVVKPVIKGAGEGLQALTKK